MNDQLAIASIAEETLDKHLELTFSDLREKVFDHPDMNKIIMNYGRDILNAMLCTALGFKRHEETNRYIIGSRDPKVKKSPLSYLLFLGWEYDEGKLRIASLYGPAGQRQQS